MSKMSNEYARRLEDAAPKPLDALKEIAKGEGAYSLDPLKHCANAVEGMQAKANEAIALVEGESNERET